MAITLDLLDYTVHSIAVKDSGGDELAIAADGSIAVTDNGGSLTVDSADLATIAGAVSGTEMQVDVISMPSVTVTATDLDIRDLTHVSDSVKVGDGTDFLAITAAGAITVDSITNAVAVTDNGGSLTVDSADLATIAGAVSGTEMQVDIVSSATIPVSATDLDIRDLTHVSDSVKIGDGTDLLAVNADGSINVQSAPAGLDSWQTSTVSATATAAEIAATPLSNRLKMIVQNLGSNHVYVGEDNTVTDSSGVMIPAKSSMEIELGATANIWAICASGQTASLRVAEFAD